MTTTQLSLVRVTAAARELIEAARLDGEKLSHFVEQASTEAAGRRKAQHAFVARGRASLACALKTGEPYGIDKVLDAMEARLDIARAASDPGQDCVSSGHPKTAFRCRSGRCDE